MELLIFCRQYYNGDSAKMGHWLDTDYEQQMIRIEGRTDLDAAQILKAKANMENKWRGRPIPGDIVEVREDGWWDNVVLKNPNSRMLKCFACVKLPGVKPVAYLADPVLDADDKYIHGHRNTVDSPYTVGQAVTETEQSVVIRDKLAQVG